jgi:DNA helicase HerA-like ATPase
MPSSSCVRVGTVQQNQTIPAYVVPDRLFGKHFAILGTTGSGKSCAAALILRRVLEVHPNAHIVVLDPHNEYAAAFPDFAEVINSNSMELPYWLYNSEEITEIVFGDAVQDGDQLREAQLLGDLIVKSKNAFPGNLEKGFQITVNTPLPYRLTELQSIIDRESGKLSNKSDLQIYLRLKAKIDRLMNDTRFKCILGGISIYDNMAKILGRIFRVPVCNRPMTILDLSSVPSEILNVIVSVVSRLTFDFAVYSDQTIPVLLVCEEAHRYIPADSRDGRAPAKRILARIAKEGRKYGVSLGIISQRPADLAISALSQCNTIFALRLTGQADQDFVRAALPDWGGGLFDFLPSLRNGEAIAVGEGISVPTRVRFDTLPPEYLPRGTTASFSAAWQGETARKSLLDAIISRWRGDS